MAGKAAGDKSLFMVNPAAVRGRAAADLRQTGLYEGSATVHIWGSFGGRMYRSRDRDEPSSGPFRLTPSRRVGGNALQDRRVDARPVYGRERPLP